MKLPAWIRQVGRSRRNGPRVIAVTLSCDVMQVQAAMAALAEAAGRFGLSSQRLADQVAFSLVLSGVRREVRQIVRDGVAEAHPWLMLPPRHARPSWHTHGRAMDVNSDA